MRRASDGKKFCVNSHPYDRIGAECIQRLDFLLASYASGNDEFAPREFAQASSRLDGETLHQAFTIDVRVEECGRKGLELCNRIVRREFYLRLPTLDGDAAIFRVDSCHDAICTDTPCECGCKVAIHTPLARKKRRAYDHTFGAGIQHLPRPVD